jgi:nucleoid-associated protein YgaU
MRRLVVPSLWVAGLGAAAAALHWAGAGPLAGPPLTEPARWAAWLDGRDPLVAAFGVLRLVALGGLWYLAAVTLVGAALRAAGAVRLVRIADRLTVGPVRRMLAGSVSLGLAASGVMAVAAPAVRLPAAVAQTSTTSTTALPPATVTMHRLGPAEPRAAPPVPQVTEISTPAPAADRWTVKPGECFWTIAEDVLANHLGRAPTDAEIVPYWRRLIEANRSELAHRDNPDLIFPTQVFVVPAP